MFDQTDQANFGWPANDVTSKWLLAQKGSPEQYGPHPPVSCTCSVLSEHQAYMVPPRIQSYAPVLVPCSSR